MKRHSLIGTLFVALSVAATAPSLALHQEPAPWNAPARKARIANPLGPGSAELSRGKELFIANCVVCHGDGGKGDGLAAAALQPHPRDLTAEEVRVQSDGELFWKLSAGRAPMPGFEAALPADDLWKLVMYMRELQMRSRYELPFDRVASAYEATRTELLSAPEQRLRGLADGLALWITEVPIPEAVRSAPAQAQAWTASIAGLKQASAKLGSAGVNPIVRADAFHQLSLALKQWDAEFRLMGTLRLRSFEQASGTDGHGPWLWLQSSEKPLSPYPQAKGAVATGSD